MNFQTRSNTEHLEGSATKRSRCSAVHDEILSFRIHMLRVTVSSFNRSTPVHSFCSPARSLLHVPIQAQHFWIPYDPQGFIFSINHLLFYQKFHFVKQYIP